jgi:hypothetical protein
MNAVPFDTLKLAKKLEASGMTGATAAGAAEAMSSAEWATKADINDLRTELKGDIAHLLTETEGGFELLRREIGIAHRDVGIKFGGMLVVVVGILLAG